MTTVESTPNVKCSNHSNMDLTSDHLYWTVKNGILANYPPLASHVTCDVAILAGKPNDYAEVFAFDR